MNPMQQHVEVIPPSGVWNKIPKGPASRPREQPLIGKLHVVEEYGFLAVAPVNMAKDVETRLDAPKFFKQIRIAKTKIQVVFRRAVCHQNIGLRRDSAKPR